MLLASSNFLVPNATFVVELVIFLVVLWALSKWILPPVNRAMDDRQKSIAAASTTPRRQKSVLWSSRNSTSGSSRRGGPRRGTLKDEAVKIGEQLREELRKQGEEEYRRLVERASADIDAACAACSRGVARTGCRPCHGRRRKGPR